jgi:pimeloyl-ACP methyl ester carboxylesterase
MDIPSRSQRIRPGRLRGRRDSIAAEILAWWGSAALQEHEPLPTHPVEAPIILLHGFASNPRAMKPLASLLGQTLNREVLCLRTSPGIADLRDCSREVSRTISRLSESSRFEYVDVIGHSMGGLIASHLLKCIDQGRRIRRVVTLGTPHRGAPLAQLGAALAGRLSHALGQMRPDSDLINELDRLPVPDGSQLLSIASSSDLIVPARYSALPPEPGHAFQLEEGVGHVQMLWAKSIRTAVVSALRGSVARSDHEIARLERVDRFTDPALAA